MLLSPISLFTPLGYDLSLEKAQPPIPVFQPFNRPPIGVCEWEAIQPKDPKNKTTKIKSDTTKVVAWVEGCLKNNTVPIVNLGMGTPTWANSNNKKPAQNKHDFYKHCADVVYALKEYPVVYEVLNEFDQHTYWQGTIKEAAEYQDIVYAVVKANNKNSKVISGGVVSLIPEGNGLRTLVKFLEYTNKMDAVGIHIYPRDVEEIERIPRMMSDVRGVMAAMGMEGKPIWVTEAGLLPAFSFPKLSFEQRKEILCKMVKYIKEGGAEVCLWYNWNTPDHGLGDRPVELWKAAEAAII